MQQWEYLTLNFGIHLNAILKIARWELEVDGKLLRGENESIRYMNELGSQGWELASMIGGTDHSGNITKSVLFFKRPKQTAPVT
jgi:hypothetical protein